MSHLVRVAVNAPLLSELTYLKGDLNIFRGCSVKVPLGNRWTNGIVLGETDAIGEFELKFIHSVNEDRPLLHEPFLQWLEWLAQYYIYPIGLVTEMAFPPLGKSKRQVKQKSSSIALFENKRDSPKKLSYEQQKVFEEILQQNGFNVHLIYGVTGSGKTEIYLQLLQSLTQKSFQALVLVPEISLTPQLIDRFRQRFGDQIAVLHSGLTNRERTKQWWSMFNGEKKILIGARSALFCPIHQLGMIIIDEEHEPSFKQEEKLKYHARDAAIMLAKKMNCPIVLGSATPSLESWNNALNKKYHLHKMNRRIDNQIMPKIITLDLKDNTLPKKNNIWWFSELLFEKITQRVEKGEQSALFLNRRGMAQTMICSDCGSSLECPNCAVTLTRHAKSELVCHYCGFYRNIPESCSFCHKNHLKSLGLGTELIEQELRILFPHSRIFRADRDEIQTHKELENMVNLMEVGKIDILIGTQMIAKGLDFPKLTLVGLILADVGFHIPDFRASERSFQLITQVSGRAGRHKSYSNGEVIIQTYNPSHESIKFSQNHDFEGFAQNEMAHRKELRFPPFGKVAVIRFHGLKREEVIKTAQQLISYAHTLVQYHKVFNNIEILGPATAPLSKIRNRYRMHALFKGEDPQAINVLCRKILNDKSHQNRKTNVVINIDPINML